MISDATPMMSSRPTKVLRWHFLRFVFYFFLVVWFFLIGCLIGPNEIMFHKMTWMAPEDFAPDVMQYCVPVVRAMKLYERSHGHRPESLDEIGPKFAAHTPTIRVNMTFSLADTPFTIRRLIPADTRYYEYITYHFTPDGGRWAVEGKLTHGSIPVPPVTLQPGGPP